MTCEVQGGSRGAHRVGTQRVKPWWCGLLGGAGPETFGFSLLHLFSIIQEKGVSGYHIPIMQN